MKLYTYCQNCNRSITTQTSLPDRIKLAQKYGKEIKLKCPHCRTEAMYHIDSIKAVKNKTQERIMLVLFLTIAAIVSVFAMDFLIHYPWPVIGAGILLIFQSPILLYFIIQRIKNKRINNFNFYFVEVKE